MVKHFNKRETLDHFIKKTFMFHFRLLFFFSKKNTQILRFANFECFYFKSLINTFFLRIHQHLKFCFIDKNFKFCFCQKIHCSEIKS